MVGRRGLGEDRCCFFLRLEGRREIGNARNVLVMGKKILREFSFRSVYIEGGGIGLERFLFSWNCLFWVYFFKVCYWVVIYYYRLRCLSIGLGERN